MLENKTILITGANRGIGKAIAQTFAEHNASLIVHARTEQKAQQLAKELSEQYSTEITSVVFDLTNYQAIKLAFNKFFAKANDLM